MPFLEGVCVRVGTDRTTGTGKGNHCCVKEIYLFIILKIIIFTAIDHFLSDPCPEYHFKQSTGMSLGNAQETPSGVCQDSVGRL